MAKQGFSGRSERAAWRRLELGFFVDELELGR